MFGKIVFNSVDFNNKKTFFLKKVYFFKDLFSSFHKTNLFYTKILAKNYFQKAEFQKVE